MISFSGPVAPKPRPVQASKADPHRSWPLRGSRICAELHRAHWADIPHRHPWPPARLPFVGFVGGEYAFHITRSSHLVRMSLTKLGNLS